MQITPVWLIINQINPAENADLEKFSALTYFGGSPDLHKLLRFLQKKALKQQCPDRETCYAVVCPESPFNAEHFRQILHKLNELVRTFLAIKAMEDHPTVKNRLLADRLEKLELNTLAQKALQKAEKDLLDAPMRGPSWHEEHLQVRRQFYSTGASGSRTQNLNLQEFSDELERSFMLRKLKLSCELISHSAVYRTSYQFGLLEAVLEQIETSETLSNDREIAVYYHCCKALLFPDDSRHFDALKPCLSYIADILPPQECRDLLLLSINYCIKKLNQGIIQYSHEGLELYQLALEKGFLLEKGEISRFTFRNVVAMGLKIGAYDWVENFIVSNQNNLPELHRESMVSFNLARLSFGRKQYGQALVYLQKADFKDTLLALAAKTLLLKIFYETQEIRLLNAAMDSFKIFLRRKKMLAYHRNNYQNFLKFLERLIAIPPTGIQEKNALRTAILAEETLAESDWFLGILK